MRGSRPGLRSPAQTRLVSAPLVPIGRLMTANTIPGPQRAYHPAPLSYPWLAIAISVVTRIQPSLGDQIRIWVSTESAPTGHVGSAGVIVARATIGTSRHP